MDYEHFVAELDGISDISYTDIMTDLILKETDSNCYNAIMKDRPSNVYKYCDFEVIINGSFPSVFNVQPGIVVLSDISYYEMGCINQGYVETSKHI